jgi:hypothetical protein
MVVGVLTVGDIEHIQLAAQEQKPVHPFIRGLRKATLPAVMEYGCLRWSQPKLNLPELPEGIARSPLGAALKEVRSDLGMRTDRATAAAWTRLDPRPYGFFVLKDESDLDSKGWKVFETVYNLSSAKVGFTHKTASQLSTALHEMAANAATHADSPIPALIGFHVANGLSLFSVADVGIGVFASLRKHPAYAGVDTHAKAIRLALHDGVSSIAPDQRGWGFREVFKAILSCDGLLRFRSVGCCIEMTGADLDADRGTESFPPQVAGFQVSVCCRLRAPKPG